jgi:hypothetical protein
MTDVNWKLVEQVVASMHEMGDLVVRRNVRLPSISEPSRRREFDVVCTGQVAGYPVRIPIECKSGKHPAGAPAIDAFIGRLQDVGLPPTSAVFVSVAGFTDGAKNRAAAVGIRTLVLVSELPEQLRAAALTALQSVVFLLADITKVTVTNDVPAPALASDVLAIRAADGALVATPIDIVWAEWRGGGIPEQLGSYGVRFELPTGFHTAANGVVTTTYGFEAEVTVRGLVATVPGNVSRHTLIDARDKIA